MLEYFLKEKKKEKLSLGQYQKGANFQKVHIGTLFTVPLKGAYKHIYI